MDVAFFCPGNKCKVRVSGLCSLPGVNMSKVGHAPEMCFLKHLYIEYLTSSRPGDLNQVGITGNFLEPDTSAACQWWGMLHVQNSTWKNATLLYTSISHHCTFGYLLVSMSHPWQLTTSVKLSDWGIQDSNNTHFQLVVFLVFSPPACYLFSPPSQAPVLRARQRGMFSYKQRRRKRLPCLPVTLEYKELLCLYGRGSKGSVS